MLSAAQVALFGVLSAHFVAAFSPLFTTPRQCERMRITWSSIDLPVVDMPMGEILLSLIPLDNDPSRTAPEPYTLSVPPGGHDIAALPFPAGTQFFASAHLPGSIGFERRIVSEVFTVEHSAHSDCLPTKSKNTDGRGKLKSFGKRQISVIGPSTVDATGIPPPANAIASPSSTGAPPAISVIGVNTIPASGPPPTGVPTPENVVPVPSASGSAPPVQVIGTSYVSTTGEALPEASSSGASNGVYSTASYGNLSSVDATTVSTFYTETATGMPEMPMVTEWVTVTVTRDNDNGIAPEAPCDSPEYPSMYTTMTPPETITVTSFPAATQITVDTEVVHYTAFSDMVDAANSMFKAWNPYKPAYTPSNGN